MYLYLLLSIVWIHFHAEFGQFLVIVLFVVAEAHIILLYNILHSQISVIQSDVQVISLVPKPRS